MIISGIDDKTKKLGGQVKKCQQTVMLVIVHIILTCIYFGLHNILQSALNCVCWITRKAKGNIMGREANQREMTLVVTSGKNMEQ